MIVAHKLLPQQQSQSVVAHEISENLESIVAIAEQTTAGSQQTAASSSEVARLSEELQQSVQEFKIVKVVFKVIYQSPLLAGFFY